MSNTPHQAPIRPLDRFSEALIFYLLSSFLGHELKMRMVGREEQCVTLKGKPRACLNASLLRAARDRQPEQRLPWWLGREKWPLAVRSDWRGRAWLLG